MGWDGREGGGSGRKKRSQAWTLPPVFCWTRVGMGTAEKVLDQEAQNKLTIQCPVSPVSDLLFN